MSNIANWTFLTNHGQVLLCIAHDRDARLRDIGDQVGITERAAHRIMGELVDAGYVVREREGRRNRYTISTDRGLPEPIARDRSIGDLLSVLAGQRAPAHTSD
jgi:predicted transcriptional regulator